MRVLVDADACPVKNIIIEIAKKYDIQVLMYFDNAHEYNDGYSKVFILDKGMDSVDFAIVNEVTIGDIVVTQDYGLAALALSKKAKCINQNGLIYTDKNIDSLLSKRHLGQKLRRSKVKTKGPKKRNIENDLNFRKSFNNLVSQKKGR